MQENPFDHRFFLVVVAYGALVLAGWICFGPTEPKTHDYLAARSLAGNHRIAAGDFKRPSSPWAGRLGFYMPSAVSITGKYVRSAAPVGSDEVISAEEFKDAPDLTIPKGFVALAFPLTANPALIGLLDAGSAVRLFGEDPGAGDKPVPRPISIPATVLAILYDPADKTAPTGYPILSVAAADEQIIAKNLKTLQLALVSPDQPGSATEGVK
jgi:hypothetical protein